MNYDPNQHHRRSIRLPAYDYGQAGAYFVTIVAHRRECLFGEMIDGNVVMNGCGEAVEHEWLRSAEIRPGVQLDAFIVMPNHVHAIVIIRDQPVVGAHSCAPLHDAPVRRSPRSLGSFVAGFKSAATKRINEIRHTPGLPVWQRNYYEHVIRNEEELNAIQQYIADNPLRWADDRENPDNVGAVREPPLRGSPCLTP